MKNESRFFELNQVKGKPTAGRFEYPVGIAGVQRLMVIVFPGNKSSAAAPAAAREQRSFAYALTLSVAISLVLWAGMAMLVRL